jgi:cell division septation protein DedD
MWAAYIMTIWTIRTETDDLGSVREMVEDQRNRGYNAWIEDESGQRVDEEPFKKSGRSLYQRVLGIVIWGTAIAVALGALYACSILSGDPMRI